ncbi:hypothetical protein NMY22_g12481 [Coprinellus aureogranulatus]|nr:hypothetical protein NMY22_g12481 [Coprinellus aureogranulatus]
MDFVKNLAGGQNNNAGTHQYPPQSSGFMGSLNNAAGGGQAGERNEDALDKGVDFVQERMGGGPQNNESAFEQAKDEQISDGIRRGYKGVTGKDFPVADK